MILVKKHRKIIGFTGKNSDGYFFAFGKPGQRSYIAFRCESEKEGVQKINKYSNN